MTEAATAPVREGHAAVVVTAVGSFASAPVPALAGVPLTNLVFQVASAQGWSGVAVAQHLLNPLFQALTTNPIDLTPVGVERVQSNPLLRVPHVADYLDGVNWHEMGSDGDWNSVKDSVRWERSGRHHATAPTASSPTMVQLAPTDRNALDRYFAEAAAPADQVTDDE